MKVKAVFPILNVGKVNVYGMEETKIIAGLQLGENQLEPEEFTIYNDDKDNSLYIQIGPTHYYLNWFTAV